MGCASRPVQGARSSGTTYSARSSSSAAHAVGSSFCHRSRLCQLLESRVTESPPASTRHRPGPWAPGRWHGRGCRDTHCPTCARHVAFTKTCLLVFYLRTCLCRWCDHTSSRHRLRSRLRAPRGRDAGPGHRPRAPRTRGLSVQAREVPPHRKATVCTALRDCKRQTCRRQINLLSSKRSKVSTFHLSAFPASFSVQFLYKPKVLPGPVKPPHFHSRPRFGDLCLSLSLGHVAKTLIALQQSSEHL